MTPLNQACCVAAMHHAGRHLYSCKHRPVAPRRRVRRWLADVLRGWL